MTGSGNDFVFVDGRSRATGAWTEHEIRALCSRREGVGADGLVVIYPAGEGRVGFDFFNNDGTPAPMCGNGALCATRLAAWLGLADPEGMELETGAGVYRTRCDGKPDTAEISLGDISGVDLLDIELEAGETFAFRATVGVPHVVVLTRDVQGLDLASRGRQIRFHPALAPGGANINFLSRSGDEWRMRTYERGVEAETMACGTGAAAAAAVLAGEGLASLPLAIRSASDHLLSITGSPVPGSHDLEDVMLGGQARLLFRAVLSGSNWSIPVNQPTSADEAPAGSQPGNRGREKAKVPVSS